MDLSIVIPAYNEEKVIESTVNSYLAFFRNKNLDFELVVIPNNCSDNTPKIVENLSKKNSEIKYKTIQQKVGKGGAIIEGLHMASGKKIVYVDADNATKPDAVFSIMNNMGDSHCVMGSRWLPGSVIKRKQPLLRRFASRGFNIMVRILLGLQFTDTQAGAKVFRKEAISRILPEIKNEGWAFDVGVLYLLNKGGFKIREIPITWEDNPDSHLNMSRVIPKMFLSLLKIRFRK